MCTVVRMRSFKTAYHVTYWASAPLRMPLLRVREIEMAHIHPAKLHEQRVSVIRESRQTLFIEVKAFFVSVDTLYCPRQCFLQSPHFSNHVQSFKI